MLFQVVGCLTLSCDFKVDGNFHKQTDNTISIMYSMRRVYTLPNILPTFTDYFVLSFSYFRL